MSGVRLLVGTRKGAFVLTSDGKRKKWDVKGPHFAGWEIYHLKGSPADPNRLYASQTSGWFGQLIQRSNDGGKTWEPVGNKFEYDGDPGYAPVVRRHASTRGSSSASGISSRRSPIRTPSMPASKTRLCSAPRTAGRPGRSCPGCAAPKVTSGSRAPVACACTRSCSIRTIRSGIFIAISAAGVFRTDDGGKTWRADEPGSSPRMSCPIRTPRSATASTASRCTRRGRTCCSCRSTGTSCAATTAASPGTRSAATCRAISGSPSTSTRTSRRRSTSSPSRATRSTTRRTASCASIAAGRAATSGRR